MAADIIGINSTIVVNTVTNVDIIVVIDSILVITRNTLTSKFIASSLNLIKVFSID